MNVLHDAAGQRFVAADDPRVELTYARGSDGALHYHHTFVPPELRGAGRAAALTEHALRYARDHGLKVVPSCPYVASYIRRHPEYRDLVAGGGSSS